MAITIAGCSDRETAGEYVPAPVVPAPARVSQGAPNALPVQAPKPVEVTNKPLPKPQPEESALTDYGNRLAMILRLKTAAGITFQHDVESAAASIDTRGMDALLPPYEKYSRAVDAAMRGVRKLNPPSSVKAIHKAILASCSRLAENLEATVGAMRDGGDAAAELNKSRRSIEASGTRAVQDAFDASGFDAVQFAMHGIFVRKG